MIERISELPWASFEAQLIQKCETYLFKNHRTLSGVGGDDGQEVDNTYNYWKTYKQKKQDSTDCADTVYCIQQQILFNAVALNDELEEAQVSDDGSDRYTDKDVFFWNDLVQKVKPDGSYDFLHEGFEPTYLGRAEQCNDPLFNNVHNDTLKEPSYSTVENQLERTDILTNLPKTHAARSLIEVSEYVGPDHPEAKHSNYVSRKVSMLWFFNVVKAIVKAFRVFPWIRVGVEETERTCRHDEAESEYDKRNDETKHGLHQFKRSVKPAIDGSLKVYGNAQFNGDVSTFHSQARFHDEVTMWDKLSVYGQSYFSKDINGTAMRVRWGDLAEFYAADAYYGAGTLVKFGGEKEVTLADGIANAVVTTNPGLVLNEQLKMKGEVEFPVGLALVGRVPVQVWGDCKKFDLLVPDPEHPGWARVQALPSEEPIARALQDKDEYDDLVLCATNFKV